MENFSMYLLWGSTTLFDKCVVLPANVGDTMEWAHEYALAGMFWCMGSMDATDVGMLKCMLKLKQFNDSCKQIMPSWTYNATVTRYHKIIYTTRGHP